MSLRVATREANSVNIVDVSGRLTLGEGATRFRETLHHLVDTGHTQILINLSGVSGLDSSGIGMLVSGFATVRHRGGHLKLLNVTSRVKDLLLLTKLYTVFETYDDEGAAVRRRSFCFGSAQVVKPPK